MIRAIVRSSLQFRLLVVGIAVGVMTVGVRSSCAMRLWTCCPSSARRTPRSRPRRSGSPAEEVEQLITVPLEADLLNGVQGVDVIRSESVPGLSSIVLVFELGPTSTARGSSSRSA